MEVTNQFKGLDLIGKVPEKLWREVQCRCTGDRDQDHPQEKEMQIAKWLSEEALKIAVKGREAKSKGEKEIYTHLNAEF